MMYHLRFDKRQEGRYNYATLRVRGMQAAVLDFWHKSPDAEPFISGNLAMEHFKKNYESAVAAFATAIGTIAAAFEDDEDMVDYVVPLIKSAGTSATADSPVGRLATAAARRLKKAVNLDIFRQTPRQTLHGREVLNFDQRYEIVYDNLTVQNLHRRTRILLVDDVISSGATASAYRQRFAESGGVVYGVLGVMKYAQEQDLLNPDIYRALVPRKK